MSRSKIIRDWYSWNHKRRELRKKRAYERNTAHLEGRLVVIGIMKNEAMVVQEWIQHYLEQGADKIILIDNGSTDDSVALAQSGISSDKVECVTRLEQWRQFRHYQDVVRKFRLRQRFQWLLIADLDEFWFCKDGGTLSNALPDKEDIDLIYVRMSIFGSSGHEKQPDSVRRSFVYKRKRLATYHETKWICRLSALKSPKQIGVHKVHGISSARTLSDEEKFQLNHYVIMSCEYFEKVKMTRGDAGYAIRESMRDWRYFRKVDEQSSDVEDTRLIEVMDQLGV